MILIVNNGSKYISDLEGVLKKFNVNYNFMSDGIDINKYNGAILSGGPYLLSTKEHFDSKKYNLSLLKNFNKPILGICLGHQLICLHYGGQIIKNKKVKGKRKIIVVNKDKLFSGLDQELIVAENHCENIIRLPKSLELLAFSTSFDIEAIKHRNKEIYGVQFHTEVSGSIGEHIIKNFLNLCYGKL